MKYMGIVGGTSAHIWWYCIPNNISLLQNSGSCEKEIKARVGRGKNAAKAIIKILEEIIFGPYESMVFIVLRNSLFISTVLTNIESIYSLTNKEIEELERCDESLLREKFSLHSKTSKEFLYLETGCLKVILN